MRFLNTALVGALAGVACAEQMADFAKETKVYKSHFGAIVEENTWDDIVKKVITFPQEKFAYDYAQQAEYLHQVTETIRAQKRREQ